MQLIPGRMKKVLLALFPIFLAAAFFVRPNAAAAIGACKTDLNPLKVITRDTDGNLLGGMNFVVYHENTNPDGQPYLSSKVLFSGKTDSGGQSDIVCLKSLDGPYAVKVYEYNPNYGYFTLFSSQLTTLNDTIFAEVRMSNLRVIFRDADGAAIKNINFDIYVQTLDVDGQPVIDETKLNVDKLIKANYSTGNVGVVRAYLAAGQYVVRVHATGGVLFFNLWNQVVADQQVTQINYRLSTLRTILVDGLGGLLKNQKFSIHQQDYDVQDNPILGTLVAADISTGSTGKGDVYLPAGAYALKIPASNQGSTYNRWKINVIDQELTTTTYRLSGFRVIIRDQNGALARNVKFSIATQKLDAAGRPIIGTTILTGLDTGEAAYRDVYLVPGTYVLIYGTKRLYRLDVFNDQFTTVDYPKTISIRPRSEVLLTSSLNNKDLTFRTRATPTIKGLKNFKKTISRAYQVRATKIVTNYNVTFYYTDQQLLAKEVVAAKLRLAFYDDSLKQWRYVGTNSPTKHQFKASLKQTGTLILVAIK